MPWRTRLLDRLTRSAAIAEEMTPAELSRMRGNMPMRRPYTWVPGTPTPGVTSTSRRITARDGYELKVRVHRPEGASGPLPLLVHFHGGGFVIGNIGIYDPWCTAVAARAQVVVVTVAYRMAPEHRAPRPSTTASTRPTGPSSTPPSWAPAPTPSGSPVTPLAATLAAAVAQQLRDAGFAGLRHRALIYPAPDLTEREVEALREADRRFVLLTPDMMRSFRSLYLGDEGDDRDPLLSPALGELAGLPPALVQTAEHDPLRPDGLAYAAALQEAGIEVRATTYRGAPHGFISFPGFAPAAHAALDELVAEVTHHLHQES
uniref:Alpha/beta hydrolase n=1 Tax=Janibacter limosus TaxID=53458 RepID=A0AC61U8R1_9MICO|nr:alpha/beta hydrolase [Janibacter limosus]